MEDYGQIKVNQYRTCIIIPFSYDDSFFGQMIKEESAGKLLGKDFQKEHIKLDGPFNEEETLTENCREKKRSLQCYKISNSGRADLGLSQNRKQCCILNKSKTKFKLEEIKVWFFKNGRGYLTLEIKLPNENLVELDKVLEFNAVRWMYRGTEFSQKIDSLDKVSVKTITEGCLKKLKCVGGKARIAEKENYYLTLVMPQLDRVDKELLNRVNLKFPLDKTINKEQQVMYSYNPYQYIHWKIADKAVSVLVDDNVKSERDKRVLKDFDKKIFNQYFIAYLYYLSKYDRYKQLKEEWEGDNKTTVREMRNKIQTGTEISKIAGIGHEHIDKIFYDILCNQVWKFQNKLMKFKEEVRYDVFISYRHDGGQYLALLLYEHLIQKGVNVFWDKACLRAGHFDEQLYEKIEQSRNLIVVLSPQCIERLIEKGDWICKELHKAFRNEQSPVPVLMVAMENVRFPDKKMIENLLQSENVRELSGKSREILEDTLNELTKCQGIQTDAALFDGVIERIVSALHLKRNGNEA